MRKREVKAEPNFQVPEVVVQRGWVPSTPDWSVCTGRGERPGFTRQGGGVCGQSQGRETARREVAAAGWELVHPEKCSEDWPRG